MTKVRSGAAHPTGAVRDVLPGLGLALGAGTGVAVGVALAGGPGVAVGIAIGAGIGLVAGAVLRGFALRRGPTHGSEAGQH